MVKYVATTHPMGQKRCRRGDSCQIVIWISIYKNYEYHQSSGRWYFCTHF
nr:MAG TPA: hypothetical protein [Caudoviricetes sp.]